eukprot:6542240-Prymnesium_polylepis.1
MCCREPDGLELGACIACLLLVEARAEQQPILALCGVQRGPHAPPSAGSCASSCGPEPEDCADSSCERCGRCEREGQWEHRRLRREALAMLLAPR